MTLYNGINIKPGTETYVGIKRMFRTKLSKPYSNCIKVLKPFNSYSKILYGYFKDLNVSYYNQDFCYKLCFQDQLIKKCNCCDIVTPSILKRHYCFTNQELYCQDQFQSNFSITNIEYLCQSSCPIECETITYELSSYQAQFPTDSYLEYLMVDEISKSFFPQNITVNSEIEDFVSKSFLRLIINYDELFYTTITDSAAITLGPLLGNIGGQLGLFIGLSVLSFVEIFEFFIETIRVLYKQFKKSKNIKQKPKIFSLQLLAK